MDKYGLILMYRVIVDARRRQEVGERQARLGAGAERAGDRGELVGLLALGVAYARLTTDDAPPDRRLVRLLLDLHEQARRPCASLPCCPFVETGGRSLAAPEQVVTVVGLVGHW